MYRIFIILLFLACNSSHKERKYYVVIRSSHPTWGNETRLDSFYTSNLIAAYDTASLKFHSMVRTYNAITSRGPKIPASKPYAVLLLDETGRSVEDAVPLSNRRRIDSFYTALSQR